MNANKQVMLITIATKGMLVMKSSALFLFKIIPQICSVKDIISYFFVGVAFLLAILLSFLE